MLYRVINCKYKLLLRGAFSIMKEEYNRLNMSKRTKILNKIILRHYLNHLRNICRRVIQSIMEHRTEGVDKLTKVCIENIKGNALNLLNHLKKIRVCKKLLVIKTRSNRKLKTLALYNLRNNVKHKLNIESLIKERISKFNLALPSKVKALILLKNVITTKLLKLGLIRLYKVKKIKNFVKSVSKIAVRRILHNAFNKLRANSFIDDAKNEKTNIKQSFACFHLQKIVSSHIASNLRTLINNILLSLQYLMCINVA